MGGQQAYQWAALYPDRVRRLAVICGAARTAPHTHVFLEGMQAQRSPPIRRWRRRLHRTARARLARNRARLGGLGPLPDVLSRAPYLELGYSASRTSWPVLGGPLPRARRENLLSMIRTWQDVRPLCEPEFGVDYERAMRAINARARDHAVPHRPVLPARGQSSSRWLLRQRASCGDPLDLGPLRRRGPHGGGPAFVDDRLRDLLGR